MKKNTIFILLISLTMSTVVGAQTNKPASDWLNVTGPITFENKSYSLSWSSHPSANFYKQEYLVKGDQADKFKTMILLDVVTGETDIKNVVAAKVAELKKMKETNPVINYEVIDNSATGEYMIDFLLTANAPDGNISIVERNVYRYKTFADKNGHKGIMLFGISARGYDADVTKFLTALKANRKDTMNKLAQYKLPEVTVMN
ncbi:MAG: hypothetical protein ABIN67_07740 [Ferruginibacter sp.]